MKRLGIIAVLFTIIFVSCSGSSTYRGKWKAVDPEGRKYEINFSAKSFSVKEIDGGIDSFEYTQNSINIENSVETYGIRLDDGRAYSIHFPLADDESKGIIIGPAGGVIYTISRDEFLSYQNLYKLNSN